jgi:hypothetical protein
MKAEAEETQLKDGEFEEQENPLKLSKQKTDDKQMLSSDDL